MAKKSKPVQFSFTQREIIALRRLLYEVSMAPSREYTSAETQHNLALERIQFKVISEVGWGVAGDY